ncbi:MAG: hypothetical protein AAF449_07920, partial [Myxococcota bacterium]
MFGKEQDSLSVRDGWELVQKAYLPDEVAFYESLFCLANGYMGVRPTLDFESEHSVPGAFYADLYDPAIAARTEIANAPNWLPLGFRLGSGEPVDWDRVELLDFERRLDMRRGMLSTEARVRTEGVGTTRIQWTTLVHATRLNCGLVRGSVTAEDWTGELGLESWIDARFGNAYMGGYQREIQTRHFNTRSASCDVQKRL